MTADEIMIDLANAINIGIEEKSNSWYIVLAKRRIDFLSIMTAYCERKTRENKRREMADAKKTCGRGGAKSEFTKRRGTVLEPSVN